MSIKFELSKEQEARYYAWHKHHWETLHRGFSPRGDAPVVSEFIFGPTGVGINVRVVCHWCNEDSPSHAVDLSEDDEGGFYIQYDENWNEL